MTDISNVVHSVPEETFLLTNRTLQQFLDRSRQLFGEQNSRVFVYHCMNGIYVANFLNPRYYRGIERTLHNQVEIKFRDEVRESVWIDRNPFVGFSLARGLLAVKTSAKYETRYVVQG